VVAFFLLNLPELIFFDENRYLCLGGRYCLEFGGMYGGAQGASGQG
jgi:hypothetical protein